MVYVLHIYHKFQPNVGKYTSPMDPMGIDVFQTCRFFTADGFGRKCCFLSSPQFGVVTPRPQCIMELENETLARNLGN